MKKIISALGVMLICYGMLTAIRLANAGITCTLPFNLQNNTTADATQVMANYNALVTCFTNAAQAGVNSDITALTALTTPISPSQGGTHDYFGTGGGSANAQTVGSVTPGGFTLTTGYTVTFFPSVSNTAALTLNVNGGGALAVWRPTQIGASVTVGGEVVVGSPVTVVYDGTRWVVRMAPDTVGAYRDFAGTIPAGWIDATGGCISRSSYPALFTTFSTVYGACDGVTTFGIPDSRGRLIAAVDASTSRYNGCAGGALGAVCGAQSVTLSQANVPNYQLLASGLTWSGQLDSAITGSNTNIGTTTLYRASDGSGGIVSQQPTVSGTVGGSINSGGSGSAFVTLAPTIMTNRAIKL